MEIAHAKTVKKTKTQPRVLALTMAFSVGLALVAIFLLTEWAEASPLHHGLQHVMIFAAGAGFGTSLFRALTKGGGHEG